MAAVWLDLLGGGTRSRRLWPSRSCPGRRSSKQCSRRKRRMAAVYPPHSGFHWSVPLLHRDPDHHWIWLPVCHWGVPSRCGDCGGPVHRGLHYWLLHDWNHHGKDGAAQEAGTDLAVLASRRHLSARWQAVPHVAPGEHAQEPHCRSTCACSAH